MVPGNHKRVKVLPCIPELPGQMRLRFLENLPQVRMTSPSLFGGRVSSQSQTCVRREVAPLLRSP